MFVDSHCHLDFPDYSGQVEQLLASMTEHRVTQALCISVNLEDFPRVLRLAEQHDRLWATVGVHPDYQDVREPSVDWLVETAQHPRIIGIGETGLDYYRLEGDLEWQRERFRVHIRAARQSGKPLIVHTRSASADTIRIMQEEGADQVGGVMHCFTEAWDVAEAALALNFYISFSGILTFKSAAALREVAARVPLDRILIETDSPYLAPVPHRGKTNQPAWVVHVAEELGRIKGLSPEAIGQATSANFRTLFRVPEH